MHRTSLITSRGDCSGLFTCEAYLLFYMNAQSSNLSRQWPSLPWLCNKGHGAEGCKVEHCSAFEGGTAPDRNCTGLEPS